ncbi:MAG: gliding motility-associated C-terminal domain-containing protein [Bacteroidia bacterium]|nr:gliding motility-associated C-terminal domain-containing protein [Bacteroidia bacterium]
MLKRLLTFTALLLFAHVALYAQPANDSCINAIPLTVTNGMCNSAQYTNVAATVEAADVAPSCWNPNTVSHTVWFSFVPDSSSVHISTNFTGYTLANTQIAVYGGTCGAFTLIACQEDIYTFNNFLLTDIIVNGLTPSTTYYIMIDGNGNQEGTFGICVENIGSPGAIQPSEDCFSAVYLCDTSTITFAVNTAGSGVLAESPGCFAGSPDLGAHWYQFTPSVSGNLCFTITPNGNANYDFALFDVTTGCPGFELTCNHDPSSAVVTGLGCAGPSCGSCYFVSNGTTYALLISRFTTGAIGFTLDFTGTTAVFGGVPIPTFTHPDSLCAGQLVSYTNNSPTQNSNLRFIWNFGDGNTSTAANPTHAYSIAGTYIVSLVASCGSGSNIRQDTIHILPGLTASVTPAVSTICNGDSVMLVGSATFNPSIVVPLTFTNNTDFPIIDFSTTQSDIAVSGINPNIFATNPVVSVCLNITHTFDGDLQISLRAPNGVDQIFLSFQNGGGGNDFTGTCFSPTASTPIGFGTPPFTGTWLPDDPFTILDTASINGTWSLIIYDAAGGDVGTLLDWSITFNSQNYLTYSWLPVTGLTDAINDSTYAMPVSSTNYTFVATDATGCPGSAPALVNVTNTPSSVFNISNNVFCTGEVGTITYTGNASAGATFNWNFGAGDTISGSGAGPYLITWPTAGTDSVTLVVQDSSCNSLTSVFYVTVNQTPAAPTASSNSPVCEGASINLSASNVTGASYNWTGPLGYNSGGQNPVIANATISPNMSGVYVVYVTVNNCPSPLATTFVAVVPNPVITAATNPVDSVCNESPLMLLTDTILGATYTWSGPSGFTSTAQDTTINPVDFSNAGTYTVIASVGSCTASSTVSIFVKVLPDSVVATSNSPICEGTDLYLYSDTFALGTETYLWTGPNGFSDPSQNPIRTGTVYTDSGPYIVNRTVNGCTSRDQIVNVQIDQQIAAQVVPDFHTCDLVTDITATTPSSGFGTWSLVTGTGSIVSPNNPISSVADVDTGVSVFMWTVVNGTCRDSILLTVTHDGLDTCGDFEYNELITPNGDNKNDRLIFTGLHKHLNNKLIIWNRWGSEVFSQDKYENYWKGRTEVNDGGNELPEGTYFFVLKIDNGTIIRKGFVELKR